MIREPHPLELQIIFHPDAHVYEVNGDKTYNSVTTVTKKFFPEFNKTRIINYLIKQNSSKYKNKTFNEIEQMWQDAANFGTNVHEMIENWFCNSTPLISSDEKTQQCLDQFQSFWAKLNDNKKVKCVRPEMRIFDSEFKVAGSIDLLVEFEDGTFQIFDWKCCGEIREGDVKFSSGFVPFEKYPDSNYFHYLIQQNLYKFILEKNYNLKIDAISLVQFHPTLSQYKIFQLPIISEDIKEMLEMHKNKTQIIKENVQIKTEAQSEYKYPIVSLPRKRFLS